MRGFLDSVAKVLDILGFLAKNLWIFLGFSPRPWKILQNLAHLPKNNCLDLGKKSQRSKNFLGKKTKTLSAGKYGQDLYKSVVYFGGNTENINLNDLLAMQWNLFKQLSIKSGKFLYVLIFRRNKLKQHAFFFQLLQWHAKAEGVAHYPD